MTKFIKERITAAGMNGTSLKNLAEATRKAIGAAFEAHKTAISPRNFGYVLGRAAQKVTKPCVELWRGMKQGFMAGE